MEVLTPHIEDIPAINYSCDGGVELAMLPVGLLIGKDNLGSLKVAERPTQRPALPSPRKIHAVTSPRHMHAYSSPECVRSAHDDADDTEGFYMDSLENETLASEVKLAEDVKGVVDGDGKESCGLIMISGINEDGCQTQPVSLHGVQEDRREVNEEDDRMEEDGVSKAQESNIEATVLNSMEAENGIRLDDADEAFKRKLESSSDENKTDLENLSIDIHRTEESENIDIRSENADCKSDSQSETYSDNDSVVSLGTSEEESAQKSDDSSKEPPKTSPSNKSKGSDKASSQHKDKAKTSQRSTSKGNNSVTSSSPLHSPNRRPITGPNRRGSNERLKISPTKHLSPRDKWKQITAPEVKKKSLTQKTNTEKNTKEDSATKSAAHEENLKPKHSEKPPSSTTNTPRDNRSPQTDGEDPLELGKSTIGAENSDAFQARRYESVHQLRRSRVQLQLQMEEIDAKLRNNLGQRNALQSLSAHMRESSRAALELKRNNQGVPFVNAVKELIKGKHEEFLEQTGFLQEYQATLPFYADLDTIFKTFTQVCERMILTTVNYNVTYLEDFHLMAGKLCGMIESIDTLYFNDYLDEDEDGVSDNEDDSARSPPSATERLLERYRRTGPEVNVLSQRTNDEILKGLETLVDILSHCNECLANISRLSLGNPKNQSLYDTFVVVSGILKGAEPLMKKFTTLKLPGVGVLSTSLQKAARIADVSKPGEKQVEELKCALGDCDGQLFITGKYIFG